MSEAAAIDTSSPEWKLACLARHVCRMPTKAARHAFLDLMRKKHTPDFMTTIEQKIRDEWGVMHPPVSASRETHVNA